MRPDAPPWRIVKETKTMNVLKEMLKKPLSQKQLIMLSIAMAGAAVILAVITGGG